MILSPLFVAFVLRAEQVSAPTLVPDKVKCVVADVQDIQSPANIRLSGWLGSRIDANAFNRLRELDPARLLEGYRKRPGRQSWDGEHVGKWLHAATLAWVNTGDPAIRKKLDYTAAELCKCQLDDGYLGTYLEKDRWTEWDVWAHKYNLLGLITYIRYTGNMAPLTTCRKMADLLCQTFGDDPGQRDIITAGAHVGMAPTSVLEPMVLLYRLTGESRYLDFCHYITRAWEQPNGPHIVSRLIGAGRVDKVGNGKAYEMLSCLNGALELYRTTGERSLAAAALRAWLDIRKNREYLTGACSYGELFHDDFDLPNYNNVGETCVTVTWEQLNIQLLRLFGAAAVADELEHISLNQLLGAQKPDGKAWGYYVQMQGTKPYSSTLDGHCCLSSGPRGIALLPTFAVTTDLAGVVVNLLEAGTASLKLRDGSLVRLKIDTKYPADGHVRLKLLSTASHPFEVKVRIPGWCSSASVKIASSPILRGIKSGYAGRLRKWKAGDQILLDLKLDSSVVMGDHLNAGKYAVKYGPLVLAADDDLLQAVGQKLPPLVKSIVVTPQAATGARKTWPGAQVFKINGKTPLVPFADVGMMGSRYRVWLPAAGLSSDNLLKAGTESRSRRGNQAGSVIDDDPSSYVVTYDGRLATEDWFAVNVNHPVAAKRFVFTHGQNFHDGGWFVASPKMPRFQIQRAVGGPWETIGELTGYPQTTATNGDFSRLKRGDRQFVLKLRSLVSFIALRVIGVPACGDNAAQSFSSCAELQAFRD